MTGPGRRSLECVHESRPPIVLSVMLVLSGQPGVAYPSHGLNAAARKPRLWSILHGC